MTLNLAARSSIITDFGLPKVPAPITDHPNNKWKIIDSPKPTSNITKEIDEIMNRITDMRLPDVGSNRVGDLGIQAVRMIVIRRKKMKKHKLKKLRKRMKYHWAKLKQRREIKKEKAFQAELVAQVKEAEKFSAEAYVAEKLQKVNDNPLPRFYKGKRLPQFLIKQLLEEDQLKREKRIARTERFERYKNWKL